MYRRQFHCFKMCLVMQRTMSASGRFELLQMLLELETERCARKDAGFQVGWIVRSHIDWRGERSKHCKGVVASPY